MKSEMQILRFTWQGRTSIMSKGPNRHSSLVSFLSVLYNCPALLPNVYAVVLVLIFMLIKSSTKQLKEIQGSCCKLYYYSGKDTMESRHLGSLVVVSLNCQLSYLHPVIKNE